jgi:hypothetical protein
MVNPRPNAWFNADFPDDTVYDDDGNEAQFAGRNVAEAIAKILTARGYSVDVPENWDENGWWLRARGKGCSFSVLITAIEDFILQTKDMTWRLWPDRAAFVEFLRHLQAGLNADPRFSQLRWFVANWPPTEAESFADPID